MPALKALTCVPCKGTEPKLTEEGIRQYMPEVPDWQVVEQDGEKRLVRTFKFKNFSEALDFTNQVGRIAEEQDHHPAITTEWGKVTVTWWTHKIGGLHQNDFIMAAKTDELYRSF
jgi:4a-hydroxytetrahydrobiopterin dehydratase